MTSVGTALFGLWRREFISFTRERSRVVSSLVSPVMWLLIVGTGIGSTVVEVKGFSYRTFIFPGIVAMLVLFTTVFLGLYIVWDKRVDALKAFLVAPVPRWALFAGKMSGGITEALIQGVMLLLVGRLFVTYDWTGVPLVIATVLLIGAGLTALGLFIGSFFESLEGFQVVVSFVVFPMFFLSGALYPLDDLPTWLLVLVRFNPLTYGVDALRTALLGPAVATYPLALDLGILAGFAIVLTILGAWSFKRMQA